jgi:hypothetical protein
MKTSFNIGFVDIESCKISKKIFVITFFGHHSLFSPCGLV